MEQNEKMKYSRPKWAYYVVLFAVLAMFSTLGETEVVPTLVAAWSPNVLFALLSMYLFLGVRS